MISATGRIADRAHGRVAERHRVAKVDLWGASAQAFRTDPSVFSPDQFHPGPSGHRVWADTVMPEIENALATLGESRPPPVPRAAHEQLGSVRGSAGGD